MQLKVAELTEELRIVTAQFESLKKWIQINSRKKIIFIKNCVCNRSEPEALRDILLYKRDKNNEIKSLKKKVTNYKDQIETYEQKCSMLKQTIEKLRKEGPNLKDTPEMKTQIRAIQIEKAIEIGKWLKSQKFN